MGSRDPPMGDLGQASDLLVPEHTGNSVIPPLLDDKSEGNEDGSLISPISEVTAKEETQVLPILDAQPNPREETLISTLSGRNSEEEILTEASFEGETLGEEALILTISEDQPDIKVIPWEDFQNTLTKLCESHLITSELRARREELAQKLESSLRVIYSVTFFSSYYLSCLIRKIPKNGIICWQLSYFTVLQQ